MSSRRQLKASEAIREVVATAVLTDMRDPRVRDVTVISVDVSPDMREAKVAVSVMGDDAQKQLSIRGLQNAAGFLQSKIANRLDTRYTPRLTFELHRGQENALAVSEILARLQAEREGQATTPPAGEPNSEQPPADSASADSASADDSVSPPDSSAADESHEHDSK